MELSLFRNQLIHHFVDEGLICCAMYTCEKEYVVVVAAIVVHWIDVSFWCAASQKQEGRRYACRNTTLQIVRYDIILVALAQIGVHLQGITLAWFGVCHV
jgi:hypothetical protein